MNYYRKLVFLALFFPAIALANASLLYSFAKKTDEKRFQNIIEEVRCVVCQNQNIAASNAPLANDLREKIYELVNEEWSDEQIKSYLHKRYGDFILLRPRFTNITFLLWGFPIISLLFIIGLSAYSLTKHVEYVRIKKS